MNQRQINREVSKATGESICTIAQRGFSVASWIPSEPGLVVLSMDLSTGTTSTRLKTQHSFSTNNCNMLLNFHISLRKEKQRYGD